MNNVVLVGRLARDPEVRYGSGSQTAVARFTLAVDRAYSKDGEQTADFISCVGFGKTAEFIEKYFTKGMKMGLQGTIRTGNYTNKDGIKVYTTDVVAERVEFVERKSEGGNAGGGNYTQAPAQQPAKASGIPEGFQAIDDDDMPF